MRTIIDSKIQIVEGKMRDWSQQDIKDEPMLFNCDWYNAVTLGSNLTNDFLCELPDDWFNGPLVIDSRVHMLMPGWHTCIPGFHHDDVPRTLANGQPNYGDDQIRSEHILALVGGDICPTEFALGKYTFDIPEENVYKHLHGEVDTLCNEGVLSRFKVPSNKLVMFDDRAWHQGTEAVGNGWRFFIRASRHFAPDGTRVQRPGKLANEVRKQVQVYMPAPFDGW